MQAKGEYCITAGEFAKMCQTTRDTLRYYERQGILVPKKNPVNGYRYYSYAQISSYYFIRTFRGLDCSVGDIKEYLLGGEEIRFDEFVEQQYDKEGSLSDRKATEYHRIILTTLALGADPTSFGSYDLVKDGTYDYQGDDLGMQGINGWIFALIALDASGAEVPQDARYTRQQIQDAILKEQNEDGSFGLMPGTSDPDLTSMALQALAPDYNTDLKVQDAADQALGWLSGHMTETGSFESYGAESAESCAQAVIALTALGIDPASDERFTKNGVNLLDGLKRFKRDNGGYAHTVDDSESNFMATEQVLMAQVALQKYENGQGSLYDFTDYKGPSQSGNYAVPVIAATLTIAAGAGVWMIFRKRGKTHA